MKSDTNHLPLQTHRYESLQYYALFLSHGYSAVQRPITRNETSLKCITKLFSAELRIYRTSKERENERLRLKREKKKELCVAMSYLGWASYVCVAGFLCVSTGL